MNGIRLGKIFGIEVRADYSWFLIFFLVLWSLAVGAFPAQYPGRPTATYFAMATAGTLLLFASLLAHEFLHSLVARKRGITVESITLFIFGGMARTRTEAKNSGDEFKIAAVGPVSSFLIALLFFAVTALGTNLGWSPAVTIVARYLAVINVALALFNLLPGFPLDGGRLLRATIWKYTGDLTKATRYATGGGKILGYVLMALGGLQMIVLGNLGGLWLLFIGWFVRTAAVASFAQHLLLESMAGVRARDVMTAAPETVAPELSIREFVDEHVLRGRHRAYPVVENGQFVGLITSDQVKTVPKEQWDTQHVSEAMAPLDQVDVVAPQDKVTEILPKLGTSKGGRVVVIEGGQVQGLLTRADLARWLELTTLARQ